MCKVQMLRALVKQRLTAAAQEIFGLFERTIAEYEEELCASKEENERQRELLDAVFNPQLRLHRADLQQLLVVQEEVPPEQQDWSSSLDQEDPHIKEDHKDQEDPVPPHIKEEQEELWTSQEGEQLQGLEEAGIKFSFTTVKSEDDEEEAQSSHLHQRQTEQMETEADGEDCGGPEPDRKSDSERPPGPDIDNETGDSSEPETDDCDDWKRNKEPSWGSNSLADQNLCICSECGKRFSNRTNLKVHMLIHTVLNPFFCTLCNIRFSQKRKLICHMKRHQPAKSHRCPEDPEPPHIKEDQEDPEPPHIKEDQEEADGEDCGEPDTEPETDDWKRNKEPSRGSNSHQKVLDQRFFADRKLYICSECGKRLGNRANLKVHMLIHTVPKPFCCTLCSGRFPQKKKLIRHMKLHHFCRCPVCNKRFRYNGDITRRLESHSGEPAGPRTYCI